MPAHPLRNGGAADGPAAAPELVERFLRVMGTNAHVVAVGADRELVDDAAKRLDDLEQRWSRFLLDSEISRCNALSGRAVAVSPETVRLVSCAVTGWQSTEGTFDPTVLNALCDAGYDRDFRSAVQRASTHDPTAPIAAPGCAEITWSDRDCTVTLPSGVRFDPGGIGKGLAADIVTEEMIAAGAAGSLVSVGGDLRVRGESLAGPTWDVAIDNAACEGEELLRLGLCDGAIATSSRLQRKWSTRTGDAHHLIDPSTGAPAVSAVAAVSAIAREGWWAEIVAKTVLIAGLGVEAGDRFNAFLVTVGADGAVAYDPRLAAIAA